MTLSFSGLSHAQLNQLQNLSLGDAPKPTPQLLDLNLDLKAAPLDITIDKVNSYFNNGEGEYFPEIPSVSMNSHVYLTDDPFLVEGKCTAQKTVVLSGDFKQSPAEVGCSQSGIWAFKNLTWNSKQSQNPWNVVLTAQYKNEQKKDAVTVSVDNGGTGAVYCVNSDEPNPYNFTICGEDEGIGGGGFIPLEITDPVNAEVVQKEDLLPVKGVCAWDYHVFLAANATKNPYYVQCSGSGTFSANSLKWLDSVEKGSNQTIYGYQVGDNDLVDGDDQVTVKIADDESGCADGIDNDNDGLIDENDPGCWLDPGDPGSYDPDDDDESDEPSCADGIDNDNDGKIDENDPGCWTDPSDPGTYDPNDDDEDDEPSCADGIDNDNDGLIDENDPGCWLDPSDPDTYDPTDDNETDPSDSPACSDGVDNDGDFDIDALDPGCYTDKNDPNTYDPNDDDEMDGSHCADGIDNDNDGLIDENDPGCWLDPSDPDTYDPTDDNEGDEPSCTDGVDNDNDGKIDMNDPGCHTDGDPNNPDSYDPTDDDEEDESGCADGIDNDNDGLIDENDPGCWLDPSDPDTYDPTDDDEGDEPSCADGVDNDNDGVADEKDPGCHTDGDPNNPDSYDPNDDNEGDEPSCADGVDNDNDGKVDEKDPGCWTDAGDPDSYDPNDDNEGNEPACADEKDNDNDGLIDKEDPGCHTDGDPNDGDDSYNPNDGFEQDEDDNGSIPYNPDEDYVGEANRQCLVYNPLRKLNFTDVTNLNSVGSRAAIALKNTYLFITNYDVSQYLLSGYGSGLQTTGESIVGMNETMKRAELAKLIMLSHCLPVLDEDTLSNFRSNGDPMVVYGDLPRSGDAPSTLLQDITYSIQFYASDEESAMRGTNEGNFEPFRAITKEEIMKPITVIQEFRTGELSPEDDTVLSLMSDRWSAAFYAKAAYQNLTQYIPNATQEPTSVVIRRNAFNLLIQAMLQRNLYNAADQATVDAIVNP